MKFTLLTVSTILAFALAAPATDQLAERQTPLIFWTFKDITGNTWSLYCKEGQSVEEVLGDIPGGPYYCGFKSLILYTFKDTNGVTRSVYCEPGQSVEEVLGDIPGGPYICGAKK
ncbi:hypothetical protein K505DRAFT_376587 [Melanomma pulvis-pyrius CBS 109.77]|uniref:Uncharacterized protein n=1 Tax=Melanomma pulvis-pyrius CBS 109.77 TaxID=1314802 RepID=A0A6A6X6G6_9PLEO|nr:hypothetical protein K505DRAFT_376587 [Melanomma pulvis-pyrius CBS 109.77]